VAGAGALEDVALAVQFTIPGARVADAARVIAGSDLVVLAVPLNRFDTVPREGFDGQIVIDAMNYWAPVDGHVPGFSEPAGTSQIVQARLAPARVVRTLNHIGYHELEADARPPGDPDRRAVALAGDDADAVAVVAKLVDSLGFDPVIAGDLTAAAAFAPGSAIFEGWLDAGAMEDALTRFRPTTRQEDPAWN
jgi:predicted dinucleotide-binding enzyme